MSETIINFVFKVYTLFLITKILKLCDWIFILTPFKFIFHIIYVIILCDIIKIYYILHMINFLYVLDILHQLLIITLIAFIIDKHKILIINVILNSCTYLFDFYFFKVLHRHCR